MFCIKIYIDKRALKYGKTKLVMIGNGMAGLRTIEEILERSQSQFDITIIGKEPYPNYNRIMLSNILQKKMTVEDTIMNPYDWYQENNIELINNDPVEKVDKENKIVTTSKGIEVEYDICIFATGSKAFVLPIPGSNLPSVIGWRTIDDTNKMIEIAQTKTRSCHWWRSSRLRVCQRTSRSRNGSDSSSFS